MGPQRRTVPLLQHGHGPSSFDAVLLAAVLWLLSPMLLAAVGAQGAGTPDLSTLLAKLEATRTALCLDSSPQTCLLDDVTYDSMVGAMRRSTLCSTEDPISILLPMAPVTPSLQRLTEFLTEQYNVSVITDTPTQLPTSAAQAFGYYYSGFGSTEHDVISWMSIESPLVANESGIFKRPPVALWAEGKFDEAADMLENATELTAAYSPSPSAYFAWLMIAYNTQVWKLTNLTAPSTWQDLLSLARQINGTDLDGDGSGDWGLCLDMAPGCFSFQLLSAIYASMAQTQGMQEGIWFNHSTFQPLFPNPAMAEALRLLRQLSEFGFPTCSTVNQLFRTGRCAMTIQWVQAHGMSRILYKDFVSWGNVSYAKLPGSAVVWAGQDPNTPYNPAVPGSGLTPCTAAAGKGGTAVCPYASQESMASGSGAVQLVNQPQFRSTSGASFLTLRRPNASDTSSAFDAAATFSGRLIRLYNEGHAIVLSMLFDPAPSPSTIEQYEAKGYSYADTVRLGSILPAMIKDPNALDITLPFGSLYRMVLDIMGQQAMRGTDADIGAIMEAGLRNFSVVQRVVPLNHTMLLYYNATLGIKYVAPAPAAPTDSNGAHLGVVLPAVLVPSLTIVMAVAATLLWMYAERMRRAHRTLLGKARPPGTGDCATLVVTDIQSSTSLWESLPSDAMDAAIRLHHRCIRAQLSTHHGYESATEGDSFICSFHKASQAAAFCAAVQIALRDADWPPELLQHPEAREIVVCSDVVQEQADGKTAGPRKAFLSKMHSRTMLDVSLPSRIRRESDLSIAGSARSAPRLMYPKRTFESRDTGLAEDNTAAHDHTQAARTSLDEDNASCHDMPGASSVSGQHAGPDGQAIDEVSLALPPSLTNHTLDLDGGPDSALAGQGTSAPVAGVNSGTTLALDTSSSSSNERQQLLRRLLHLPAFVDAISGAFIRVADIGQRTAAVAPIEASGLSSLRMLSMFFSRGSASTLPQKLQNQACGDVSGVPITTVLGWSWLQLLQARHQEIASLANGANPYAARVRAKHLLPSSVEEGYAIIFRGLRVRMGVHSCLLASHEVATDKATQRLQYIGTPLNVTKTVGDAAQGGMVLMSAGAFLQMQEDMAQLAREDHRSGASAKTSLGQLVVIYAGRHDVGLSSSVAAHVSLQTSPVVMTGVRASVNGAGPTRGSEGWLQRMRGIATSRQQQPPAKATTPHGAAPQAPTEVIDHHGDATAMGRSSQPAVTISSAKTAEVRVLQVAVPHDSKHMPAARRATENSSAEAVTLPELPGIDLYMALPMTLHARLGHLGHVRSKHVFLQGTLSAPAPAAAIAFMYAYGASTLLTSCPGPARMALAIFQTCVLQQLSLAGGYLVETSDGFVLAAFPHPALAITWALACGDDLNQQEWPEEILEHELGMEVVQLAPRADAIHSPSFGALLPGFGRAVTSGEAHGHTGNAKEAISDHDIFNSGNATNSGVRREAGAVVTLVRGIRLRCGIDVGVIKPELHPMTGRMEYRGRVMNRAARICGKAAQGQVLTSSVAWMLTEEHEAAMDAAVCGHKLGAFDLKGVAEPIELVSCTRGGIAATTTMTTTTER